MTRSEIRGHGLHQRFPNLIDQKKIRYDDMTTTLSPQETSKSLKNEQEGNKEKLLQFLSMKRKPQFVIVITYLSIFMLGVAIGFAPFIKVYVETCQEDRQLVDNLPKYFNKLNKILVDMVELGKKMNRSESDGILQKYPQLANMYINTAYGIGSSNITITCPFKIKIVFIEYSGTKADRGTIDVFNKYCQRHVPKNGGSNVCVVSLSLVYGKDVYYDKSAFTVIQYRCEHG